VTEELAGEHRLFGKRAVTRFLSQPFPTISQVKDVIKIARKQKRKNQGTPNKAPFVKKFSIWAKKWYTVSGLVNGPLRPRTHSRTLYVP
jgi:hypothetical protein